MTRATTVFGGLLLAPSPLPGHAASAGSTVRLPCGRGPGVWCPHTATASGPVAQTSRTAPARIAAAYAPSSGASGFHPARKNAFEAPPPETAQDDAASSGFAPGESTARGRHIVEWTLLAAPLAAYALSPAIDHRLHYESSGIWTRKYQLDFEHLVMLGELGSALWYGGKSRIGKTFWRAVDASVYTAVTTTAMKYAFSRARPRQSKSPDRWFQGNCCQSFPSGEVSFQASVVTPFIAEYHKDHPWVWALEALPAYDAVARMKTHGHWQTDVLAAWAIGTAWGLYAHDEHNPLILSFMPHGVMVGLHEHF